MKRTLTWMGRLLTAALLALFGITVLVPALTGSTTLTVLTGSMEPTIAPGSLVIVRPVAAEDIRVGSVITFRPASNEDILVTHRVVSQSISGAGATWTTRGDANGSDDAPIVYEQVRGKVLFSLPYLGSVRQGLLSAGPTPLVGVAVIMVVALLWPLFVKRGKGGRGRRGGQESHGVPEGDQATGPDTGDLESSRPRDVAPVGCAADAVPHDLVASATHPTPTTQNPRGA